MGTLSGSCGTQASCWFPAATLGLGGALHIPNLNTDPSQMRPVPGEPSLPAARPQTMTQLNSGRGYVTLKRSAHSLGKVEWDHMWPLWVSLS